ncbi:hypothetical protein IJG04_02085 [Candidatus Saccharibacteria bacterium]|nr:hypothetical protein [Candidatus Saccharibacteria bacterium]
MSDKKKQIKYYGITAIILSLPVVIPSIILLLSMLSGVGKQTQYGYSLYATFLVVLGTIPSLLSIIFGIISYSKYHKDKHLYQNYKKLITFALLSSIMSAVLMILDLILDTFIFP